MPCWVCNPSCEKCRPKIIHCPQCGEADFLSDEKCRVCAYEFTDEDRDLVRKKWESARMEE